MRSLFAKIFLWFWLAMTIIGAFGAVVALSTDPRAAALARHEKELLGMAGALIDVYEKQGRDALARRCDIIKRESRISVFLFRGKGGSLSGSAVPDEGMETAAKSSVTGQPRDSPARNGIWYALPAGKGYTILARLPPPSPLERIFEPQLFGLRLAVTFVVAGIFCYLLARSLTAPILKLGKATRRFAEGELATRVGPELGKRKDEIADLGRDFDRMAERIEALVGAQRNLLRDISHELRSPLARLNVALELARRHSGPDAGKALDRIECESERLNQLIGQLVTLALLESGAGKIGMTHINLAHLLSRIVEDADFEAGERSRSVRVVSCEEITVTGSEEMLRRAIENVLRNAVRYTDKGTSVEVSLLRVNATGRSRALIRVRDYGPGVPEKALPLLFQPFYRVADARDRLSGGTGVGLAITERAVHLHGGTVTASNEPGGGLVVEINLPVTGDKTDC